MITGLPQTLVLSDGNEHAIRWDFRDVLNIFEDINDPDAGDQERAYYLLLGLYEDFDTLPPELYEEAMERGLWFLNGGEDTPQRKAPQLMSWEQDYPIIIPAINRVAGKEVRELPTLHWWTFLGYYQEIGGDCTFAQVVGIRSKLRRGKNLEKSEREYYERNRHLIDLKQKKTADEEDFLTSLVNKRR